MGFIAGRYTATWNSLALGQSADGLRVMHQIFKRLITGDAWGDTPQDGIYRGAAVMVSVNLIEYNAAAIATLKWPYNATAWDMGVIGRLDVGSSLVKSLVLTAVASTPAASTPASITMANTILAENFPVEILLAPDLREVPIRLRTYPNGSGVFATET